MSSASELVDREGRPAFVRFERRAVEDKAATQSAGRWVGRDVDYALITAPYTRDVMPMKVTQWLELIRSQYDSGQIKQSWYDDYVKSYEAFKRGEETPLNGTPVKGWGVISPAQQKTLIEMHILTVEDLAAVNDEGIRRIGMGANDLRNKARAWLTQLNDKGPLTLKVADLEREKDNLSCQVSALTTQVGALMERLSMYERKVAVNNVYSPGPHIEKSMISAEDILDTEPEDSKQIPRKRGRPAQNNDAVT